MKSFVTTGDVPLGYVTPSFPSLYWPLNNEKFSLSYLYYTSDIWRFTVYWTLIFFAGFYGSAGLIASYSHRKTAGGIWIMFFYLVAGGIQAIASGTVVGLLIAVIYKAGLFAMSTWVPLSCALMQILFNVSTSYLTAGMII